MLAAGASGPRYGESDAPEAVCAVYAAEAVCAVYAAEAVCAVYAAEAAGAAGRLSGFEKENLEFL